MVCHSQLDRVNSFSLIGIAGALLMLSPDSSFAMLGEYTFYCDAAGGDDHGFVVVAGYLSTFEKWLSFEKNWNLHLAAYDLPYFHMKEFAQSKGAFAEWDNNEDRRRAFLGRAASIIADHVERSFACIVEFKSFNRINERYCLDDLAGCPYALAAINCVAQTANQMQRRDIAYVFEDGDKGKGELMRIMEREGYPSPIFRPSRDIQVKGHIVRGLVPLQAADFAAYELRKVFKDDPAETWPLEKYRKSLRVLARIGASNVHDWGRLREKELVFICKSKGARLRHPI